MAVLIDAGAFLILGSAVFEGSGGTKCAVFARISNGGIVAYTDIDGTPSLIGSAQTASTIFGGGSLARLHACIDSADVIHVIAVHGSSTQTRDVAYNTISDVEGTPAWGTWEEAAPHTQATAISSPACAITVDSNDDPHVLFIDNPKEHGTSYQQVTYTEKTGASWSASENISDTPTYNYFFNNITVKASDNFEAGFNGPGVDYTYKTRTSGTWGSESAHTAVNAGLSDNHGILVTTGGTVYRYWWDRTAQYNIYEDSSDTTYDLYDAGLADLSASLYNDSDRYILFIDTGQDIHMLKNDGGGWTDEGDLVVGTHVGVNVSWQYLNHNVVDELIYIYEDNLNDVYYETYDLTVVNRRIFLTHV